RLSIAANRDAGNKAHFFKHALAFVVKEEIRRRVIGHVDIGPTVVVVISKDHAEALAVGPVNAGLAADIFECAVAVVAVKNVGLAVINIGMAIDAGVSGVNAVLVVGGAEVHVVCDVQVHVPVVIDVTKRATGAPEL